MSESAAPQSPPPGKVLIYAIHRTESWWRRVGETLGWGEPVVVTDRRGAGDRWITDDFYGAYRRFRAEGAQASLLVSNEEIADVLARCRTLRSLPRDQARAMTLAMAEAFDKVLEAERPDLVLSFPIDGYVTDTLARRAAARGIPYLELTASPVPDMSMLLHRGQLIRSGAAPAPALVARKVREIADPAFTPSYVQGQSKYTRVRFLRVFFYFYLRSILLLLYSLVRRDPLNLHYLDAQPFLKHKPRLSDLRITALVDADWRDKLAAFPKTKRIFLGLQVFPEASIDYWIAPIDVIAHEDLLVEVARAFSAAGFLILVKDHPLQYGFRRLPFIDRLRKISNVVLVPYDVSGNELLTLTDVNFTCTGTLGLQAALLGLSSISTDSYYTTPEDFVIFRARAEVADLPRRVAEATPASRLGERQDRIVANLLRGSFYGDFYSFRKFRSAKGAPAAAALGQALGDQLRRLREEGVLDGRGIG